MPIKVTDLKKTFSDNIIFDGLNIEFQDSRISCILGPSGVGKSTLFNIISKIESYDGGTIEGADKKRIAYVFQEDRLLEWKTVYENIAFVIADEKDVKHRVDEAIKSVKLTGYEKYYPKELSGGMRRRVALARAFVYNPDIMILDEPFKGLDIALKEDVMNDFYEQWKKNKFLVIMATHDIDEAVLLAYDIFILSKKPAVVKFEIDAKTMSKDTLESIIREHLEEAQ
ncbi:MAG: ATP-binding cassette domain-containing protein [Eubacteriaceae bacterium]|nr:ATP-binding cassette domain-containing protein [Eubacteriaceae bacterium]